MKYYTRRKQWFEREVNFIRKNPLDCLGKAEREELYHIDNYYYSIELDENGEPVAIKVSNFNTAEELAKYQLV